MLHLEISKGSFENENFDKDKATKSKVPKVFYLVWMTTMYCLCSFIVSEKLKVFIKLVLALIK